MFVAGGPVLSKEHDLVVLQGRFTRRGASNGALVAVNDANSKPLCHGLTCSRTAAGVYLFTYAALAVPPLLLGAGCGVLSAVPSPVASQPRVIVAGVSISFTIFTCSTGTAYDPTAAEEVWVQIIGKNSAVP